MNLFDKTLASRRQAVARANDALRENMVGNNASVFATCGVALSPDYRKVIEAVKNFTDFDPDNDPYGEHDFGSVEVSGTKYFWKIDYYDEKLEMGVDPIEEEPNRVLTIMRADEY